MSDQDVPTVESPVHLSYPFLRLQDSDTRMAAVLVCAILVMGEFYGFVGFLSGVAVLVWLLWPMHLNRRYYTFGEKLYDLYIAKYLKGVLAENPAALEADGVSPKRRARTNFLSRTPAFPLRVDSALAGDDRTIGLIWNARRKTYSLLIGSLGSDIAGMRPQDQFMRLEQIAGAIRMAGASEGVTLRVGFCIHGRPYNETQLDVSHNENTPPGIFVPQAYVERAKTGQSIDDLYAAGILTKDDVRNARLKVIQDESRAEVVNRGTDTNMVAVVTIVRSKRLKSAASGRKPLIAGEVTKEQIYQLSQEILEGLERATVHEPKVLDRQECEDFVRAAWDVVGLRRYFAEQNDPGYSFDESHDRYLPEYGMYATRKMGIIDQTGHVTVMLTKLPKHIEPDLIPRLFTESRARVQWTSRSLVSESSSGTAEYLSMEWGGRILEGMMSATTLFRPGAKTRNRLDSLDEKQERRAEQNHAEYFNVFLSAAGEDPVQLEADAAELIRMAKLIGGRAKRIKGHSRQLPAALTAATGIPLL